MIKLMYKASTKLSTVNTSQGQIQDFVLGGTKVGEGSGDRLRSPAGSALVGGPGGQSPPEALTVATMIWLFFTDYLCHK